MPELSQSNPHHVTAADRQRQLGPWSGPPFDPTLAREELLHELFEATVDAHGPSLAAVMGGHSLTYRQLEDQANRIARVLRERGAGRGSYVGLLLPRSLDVYAALLGILKAGAAYVPLDPDYPPERIGRILQDAGAKLLVSVSGLAAALAPGAFTPVLLDLEGAALADQAPVRFTRAQTGLGPDDAAYAIFTSGSTGQPKGVALAHRSVCNLVRAEGRLFGVGPQDRVFQGFSIAFDASVEEVWLAFHAGATLVAGSAAELRSGPELPGLLSRLGVTVLSTVPTLLSTFEEDLPAVRLLIVGGEACPPDLVARWARPGRRFCNTYGPTEGTVIATWCDLEPGRPVTIGRAVPNDRVYVLDEGQGLVPAGEPGELCLSGVGLALGYLGRPDLTAERFLDNPYADGPSTRKLYRTGDRVRFTAEGELEFLGRLDDQVKLRGFRVELGEIENVLREQPEVLSAVVAVYGGDGPDRLVAYVVPRAGAEPAAAALRAALRKRLPAYMIPASVEFLAELPTLPSGKVDRKRLPAPQAAAPAPAEAGAAPRSEAERILAACWSRLFHREDLGVDEDFFTDLGGHSLLAAVMVSELRKTPAFASLAVPDVYAMPTVAALAREMEARAAAPAASATGAGAPAAGAVSGAGRFFCHLGQWLGLYPVLGFFGMQWLAPYLTYSYMIDHDYSQKVALLLSLFGLLILHPLMYLLVVAVKWVVLGRIRPGVHRLWGFYYWRWWLVTRFLAATPTTYMVGTPWLRIYLRLMGARIGSDVHFASDSVRAFDLLTVGPDASIGVDARLEGYTIRDGLLIIGPITVGARCYVGARSLLGPGSVMEDGSSLGELSLLPEGGRIPAGQRWVGSPAGPVPAGDEDRARAATPPHRGSRLRKLAFLGLSAVGVFFIPVAFLTAIFPGMVLLSDMYLRIPGYFGYLWAAPVAATSYIVLLALEIVVVKWLILGRVRAGRYGLVSAFALRKWFVDQFMEVSLDLLAPLYATLYLNPWYRLLGARLGARAEISTAGAATPDLLEIGEEAFIADAASLGTPHYDLGWGDLQPTRVGRRAFVGNSATVPGGTVLGDQALVGVLSTPPLDPASAAQFDASWLGSPPIFLPRRQHAAGFLEENTFRPSRGLVALRLFIEFFRIILPATGMAVLTCLLLTAVSELDDRFSTGVALALFPVLYFLAGVAACLAVAAMKWLLMGRYRPTEKPLWCSFVWRTELVTALHEDLAVPWILQVTLGTPLVPWFFRLLGARIGKGVHMETICLTEYDLITIGDGVCLGADATLQTHLFEDRVMKMSTVVVGPGCSVGTDAVVLYDTRMEAGATLGDLSLLMKGESLPAGTRWEGSPARMLSGVPGPSNPAAPRPAPVPWKPAVLLGGAGATQEGALRGRLLEALGARGPLHLTKDAHGRPVARAGGVPFTFSHSRAQGAYAAVLAPRGRVGVDLAPCEVPEAVEDHFHPNERGWLATFGPRERREAAARCWAAKEALLKALGFGLAFGAAQVELAPDGAGGLRLVTLAAQSALAQGWHLDLSRVQGPQGPLVLAVAWAEA